MTSTGTYSFSNVPPGHYTLTFVVDPDNDPHLIAGHIDLPAALAVDVLPEPRHVRGPPGRPAARGDAHRHVLDGDNGRQPRSAGADVVIPEVPAVPGLPSPKTTTADDGSFSLTVWDVPRRCRW